MPVKTTGTWATWGLVALSCALGCATGTQSEGQLTDPIDQGGSGGSAGSSSSSAGVGAGDGTSGSFATGGAGASSVAGSGTSGTFAASGTFNAAAGTFGMAGGGAASGGTAGAGGAGGAGGKGGAGGTGGAAAGASGSGGSGGTGGKAGNNPCLSTKLTITSATGTEENASLSPNLAIDGDMATRWASEKSEPQTLTLDLGEVVTVKRVLINWEAAYATKYELQIAASAAGPFTTIYTDSAGNGATDDVTTLTASDGRYLRMNGITRKLAYGFSIYEIAVYGDKDETCQ